MREKALQTYLDSVEDITASQEYKDDIARWTLLKYSGLDEQSKGRVVDAIAETAIRASGSLGIPTPKIGILYLWGDEEGKKKWRNAAALVLRPDEKSEIDFTIYFNPKTLLNFLSAIRQVTVHECYHLWQNTKFPNTMRAYQLPDDNLPSVDFKRAHNQLRVERAANMFRGMYSHHSITIAGRRALREGAA
jgi:hypothetical protein